MNVIPGTATLTIELRALTDAVLSDESELQLESRAGCARTAPSTRGQPGSRFAHRACGDGPRAPRHARTCRSVCRHRDAGAAEWRWGLRRPCRGARAGGHDLHSMREDGPSHSPAETASPEDIALRRRRAATDHSSACGGVWRRPNQGQMLIEPVTVGIDCPIGDAGLREHVRAGMAPAPTADHGW